MHLMEGVLGRWSLGFCLAPTVLLTDLVWLNGDVRSMFIMATVEGTGLCSDGIVAA